MTDETARRREQKKKHVAKIKRDMRRFQKAIEQTAHEMRRTRHLAEPLGDVLDRVDAERKMFAFVRNTQQDYYLAITLALQLYYAIFASDDPAGTLKRLMQQSQFRFDSRCSPALIVVRAVIGYSVDEEMRRIDDNRASRDAAALEHLAGLGLGAAEVLELAQRPGEGLESWADATRSKRKDGQRATRNNADTVSEEAPDDNHRRNPAVGQTSGASDDEPKSSSHGPTGGPAQQTKSNGGPVRIGGESSASDKDNLNPQEKSNKAGPPVETADADSDAALLFGRLIPWTDELASVVTDEPNWSFRQCDGAFFIIMSVQLGNVDPRERPLEAAHDAVNRFGKQLQAWAKKLGMTIPSRPSF